MMNDDEFHRRLKNMTLNKIIFITKKDARKFKQEGILNYREIPGVTMFNRPKAFKIIKEEYGNEVIFLATRDKENKLLLLRGNIWSQLTNYY